MSVPLRSGMGIGDTLAMEFYRRSEDWRCGLHGEEGLGERC